MSNDINIVWNSDSRQLVADVQKRQAIQDVEINKLKQLAQQFKTVGNSAGDAFSKMNEQQREARRLTDRVGTSTDKLAARIRRYSELLNAGVISQKIFNRAVADANVASVKAVAANEKTGLSVSQLTSRYLGLYSAYEMVRSGAQFWMQANREAIRTAEEALLKQEQLLTRYRAQAGLDRIGGKSAKKKINLAALATSTTTEEAFGAATAMVSTGFDPQAVEDGALVQFLKLLKTQALDPKKAESPSEMAEAVSKFMQGNNIAKTAGNMGDVAVAIQGMKETPLKMSDLKQLAEHSADLRQIGKMDWRTQLAVFSHLGGSEGFEMAGTHMREIINQLATAGTDKGAVEQLNRMGLRPEDVDFVGEGFEQVMQRIKGGLAKMPEQERAGALKKLAETRNISSLLTVMNGLSEIDELKKKTGDVAGFEKDFGITTEGQNAALNRAGVKLEVAQAARDENSATDRKSVQVQLEQEIRSPLVRAMNMWMYDFQDALWGHQAHMENSVDASDPAVQRELERRRLEREQAQAASQDLNRLAREQRNPPPVNVQVQVVLPGQGEKPGKVPAAGLGQGG